MRRLFCLILAICALISLVGCSGEKVEDPISFYYVRSKYTYGAEDSVIAEEFRSASEYSSVYHIINSYLDGPKDIDLDCPFPPGTKLMSLRFEEDTAHITLSSHIIALSKAKQTLAGVCLAKTICGFNGIQAVQIEAEAIPFGSIEPIIISMDNIHLYDSITAETETENE